VTPSFEGFRVWLHDLQWLFSEGFALRTAHAVERGRRAKGHHDLVPFDDETLGGCIDFSAFIEAVHHLTGELEGLVIRYDPSPHSLQTATDG